MAQNYLDHDDKVKYIDGLLAHSKEWQWFIDLLQDTFEIEEVSSGKEFLTNNHASRDVLSYFVSILGVSQNDFTFSKPEFEDIWVIAKFYIGNVSFENATKKMQTKSGELLLFCVFITKLDNAGNDSGEKCIYNPSILLQKNYFQLVNIEAFLLCQKELLRYAEKLSVDDFDSVLTCLKDNLAHKVYPCPEGFFVQHHDQIMHFNAFSYQRVKAPEFSTWQEQHLLDLLAVSFVEAKIQPTFSFGTSSFPNPSTWQPDRLSAIATFFQHPSADFVTETIAFVAYGTEPSKSTKISHLSLLETALVKEENPIVVFRSSSFAVVEILFEKKLLKDCKEDAAYLNLLRQIHSITNPEHILVLQKHHFPLSAQQLEALTTFVRDKHKRIDQIKDTSEFLDFLVDDAVPNMIDNKNLEKTSSLFDACIVSDRSILVASLFYRYMVFLFDVYQKNQVADKRWIHQEMIRIQELWQKKYFAQQRKKMQSFSFKQEIPSKEIKHFNTCALANPIIFAKSCIPCTEKDIIEIMQRTSEYPMVHLVTRVQISPIFPNGGAKINFARHDIDSILLNQVETLLAEKGYKFLNILDASAYVCEIHDTYVHNTNISVNSFFKTKALYQKVKSCSPVKLLPFCNCPTVAMLTQLFPVLEIKIREFAKLFGIFPFKQSLDEFMQHNDPSSLLRNVLQIIITEQGTFENVPDLLFVYNMMYNSNSLNIRNECVHGRNYLRGAALNFAIKATLFAIYMISFRIETIRANESDILELSPQDEGQVN